MSSTDHFTNEPTISVMHREGSTSVRWSTDRGGEFVVQVFDGDPTEGNSHVQFGAPDGTTHSRAVVPDEVFVEYARGVAEVNEIVTARIIARKTEQAEPLIEDEPNDIPDGIAEHLTRSQARSQVKS